MKIDAYIEVGARADIHHDLLPVDAKVEIRLGSMFAGDSTQRCPDRRSSV